LKKAMAQELNAIVRAKVTTAGFVYVDVAAGFAFHGWGHRAARDSAHITAPRDRSGRLR
jgi:hypothetical protein